MMDKRTRDIRQGTEKSRCPEGVFAPLAVQFSRSDVSTPSIRHMALLEIPQLCDTHRFKIGGQAVIV